MDIESIKNFFNEMTPFSSEEDIPDIPIVDNDIYKNIIIPNLIRCGAIPKKELIVGYTYVGSCRNTTSAIWDGNYFKYDRVKFGCVYVDNVNHFEDDDGYDVFVPIKIVENDRIKQNLQ